MNVSRRAFYETLYPQAVTKPGDVQRSTNGAKTVETTSEQKALLAAEARMNPVRNPISEAFVAKVRAAGQAASNGSGAANVGNMDTFSTK